mgnify:CR=1 FL=1
MHHFSHRLSFLIILVLLTVAAHAQNDMEYGYRPKMLVYENLKNDSVLRDFRRRFHLMERVVFHPVSYVMPQAPLFGFPCGDALSDTFRKSMLLNSSNFHYLKAEDFHFCLTTSEKENQWEKKIIPRKC